MPMVDDKPSVKNWLTVIEHIVKCSVGIVKDLSNLFSLEVKLAGKSLAIILILGVIGILLLLSCWLSLLGAAITGLAYFHLSLPVALLLIAAFNLLIAIIIMGCIAKFSRYLVFKETRQQLKLARDDHEGSK
jgi:hypothetical protein